MYLYHLMKEKANFKLQRIKKTVNAYKTWPDLNFYFQPGPLAELLDRGPVAHSRPPLRFLFFLFFFKIFLFI